MPKAGWPSDTGGWSVELTRALGFDPSGSALMFRPREEYKRPAVSTDFAVIVHRPTSRPIAGLHPQRRDSSGAALVGVGPPHLRDNEGRLVGENHADIERHHDRYGGYPDRDNAPL